MIRNGFFAGYKFALIKHIKFVPNRMNSIGMMTKSSGYKLEPYARVYKAEKTIHVYFSIHIAMRIVGQSFHTHVNIDGMSAAEAERET